MLKLPEDFIFGGATAAYQEPLRKVAKALLLGMTF